VFLTKTKNLQAVYKSAYASFDNVVSNSKKIVMKRGVHYAPKKMLVNGFGYLLDDFRALTVAGGLRCVFVRNNKKFANIQSLGCAFCCFSLNAENIRVSNVLGFFTRSVY